MERLQAPQSFLPPLAQFNWCLSRTRGSLLSCTTLPFPPFQRHVCVRSNGWANRCDITHLLKPIAPAQRAGGRPSGSQALSLREMPNSSFSKKPWLKRKQREAEEMALWLRTGASLGKVLSLVPVSESYGPQLLSTVRIQASGWACP